MLIHLSGGKSFLLLTLEQKVEGFLLIGNCLGGKPSNVHLSLGIILDGDASLIVSWSI